VSQTPKATERVSPIAMMRAHVASRHTNARNAGVAAFTQPIRMSPPAWTAPTVQMSAHLPPHRAAMEGRFLPVCLWTHKDWVGEKNP
jgi:hypothetical protein